MAELFQWISEWFNYLIVWILESLNYWVVLIFMLIESTFIPFPSEVIVPPAAWLAMNSDVMNIFMVVVVATLGADLGALINYFLARWLGRPVIYKFANSKFGHFCLLNQEKVEQAEEYFRKHGTVSTFIGRLVPVIRQLISIPAGLSKMKIGPFLFYTTLGAGIWNVVLASIGYAIYKIFPNVKTPQDVADLATEYSHAIGYCILAVVALGICWMIYKKTKKSSK
jgi:membrane protein DedA with SNARE-associated domain